MGLFLRNRQVAGNICFVVFLAMLFTVLPGQLFADKAFAAPAQVSGQVYYNTPNADTSKGTEMVKLDPISNADFSSTLSMIMNKIVGFGTNNLVYKLTYQSTYDQVYSTVYSVYLWVYSNGLATGTTTSDSIYYKIYTGVYKTANVKVWTPPKKSGGNGSTVIPVTPVVPEVTTATPAAQASVIAKLATYKPTAIQGKQLKAINAILLKDKFLKNAPSANNVLITVGQNKILVPKIIITSAKVVAIAPLTSNKLDPKAVNYKIGVIKSFLAAQGIKNIPVRYVFLNADPKLKVSVKAGSYFKVATGENLAKAIKTSFVYNVVVAAKAKIVKAFGIK